MNGFPWEQVFALAGLVVPVLAGLWEFVLAGRKRLGYRVQMDTTAQELNAAPDAGVLRQMQGVDEAALRQPSFVLLRIENSGWVPIVESDYLAADDNPGITVRFEGRRVVGMVMTEPSRDSLRGFFNSVQPPEGSDERRATSRRRFRIGDGDRVVELPKVKLNPGDYYKVLAVLDREDGFTASRFPDPVVDGAIVGGVRHGRIKRTEYLPFASRSVRVLIAVLVLVGIGQSLFSFTREDARAAPLDCAKGQLVLSGSTAFAPVLREAAKQYRKTCPEAHIPLSSDSFQGSVPGLTSLNAAGSGTDPTKTSGLGDRLTFSDGPKSAGHPQLLPRPVALSIFALVVNKDVGVMDLTTDQVRKIYDGTYTNWRQLGGRNVPVHLVSRGAGSGTRTTLQHQILGDARIPAATVDDCAELAHDRPGRCEVGDTETLLDTVAAAPGALGHSEVGSATARGDRIAVLRIDGQPATLQGVDDGDYPYWQTEYAYTYGQPPAGSLAAGFLRYLADEVGQDIIRAHGDRPCAELEKPLLCRPS